MKSALHCIIFVAAAVALTSCEKQEGVQTTSPISVKTFAVTKGAAAKTASVTGDIRARVQTELSFRVSGQIVERLVDVGAAVKAGDVLARIDAQEQRADVAVAEANLQAAQAQELQARLTFQRQKSLFQTQVATRAALDEAQETLTRAEGSVASAQAQLDTARDALSYTELRADADGIITERNAEVGQVAQAAQSVFSLAHDGPRDAVFDVYEALYLGDKPEGNVTVTLLSNPTRQHAAPVREVSPTIDTSTGTIRVKVDLGDAPDMPLGAPVAGTFHSSSVEKIELPWSALTSEAGHPAVWVVDPGTSKVSLREVQVGAYETGKFEVDAGLSPGDLVVAEGLKFLRPGQQVVHESAKGE